MPDIMTFLSDRGTSNQKDWRDREDVVAHPIQKIEILLGWNT
jgi:hypothetical protein